MSETPLTTAEADALSGVTDGDLDFTYLTIGESPYYTSAYRCWEKLVRVVKAINALRVYQDGDLTFGVRPGRYTDGQAARDYAGACGQALTNNDTNYIYLTAEGTLTVNTSGFPDAGSTPHLPLATIETAGGSYGREDITDYRGRAMLHAVTALTPAEMNVLHEWADAGGLARSHLAEEALTSCPVPLMLCRNADGTVMDAGGGAGKFYIHSFGWGSGHLMLEGQAAQGNTEIDTLSFEFVLPPEYVAGADVELIVHARRSGSGTPGTCTIDAEVFELDDTGTAGVIRSSSTKDLTGSWADHAFDDIAVTGLAPGDRLIVFLRTSVQETGGTSSMNGQIGSVTVKMDIRG